MRGSEMRCKYIMPESRVPSLYDSRSQAAIWIRTSVSERVVSSKPGVSTKIRRLEGSLGCGSIITGWISAVQERNLWPTRASSRPVTVLMN